MKFKYYAKTYKNRNLHGIFLKTLPNSSSVRRVSLTQNCIVR